MGVRPSSSESPPSLLGLIIHLDLSPYGISVIPYSSKSRRSCARVGTLPEQGRWLLEWKCLYQSNVRMVGQSRLHWSHVPCEWRGRGNIPAMCCLDSSSSRSTVTPWMTVGGSDPNHPERARARVSESESERGRTRARGVISQGSDTEQCGLAPRESRGACVGQSREDRKSNATGQ
jgi:hypothetical protein